MIDSGCLRVLLAEDEAIVALDLRFILEDMGHEVVATVARVRDGLDRGLSCNPDVAVLDVRLRDGEVFRLADALLAAGVRLIFHSGHLDKEHIDERYPGAKFCPKPMTEARLRDCLREVLDPA
ncbi:Response regulator receiver domain-containing protein [Tranquillimonas rosea]|uniref:Response regulator receiver domain-containing protein n=1 Tax=Tranquillimonas rosea TaxID=641238 RepID=A0A1H9RCV8_9RHOB|nr:response regulator [Tranquillimonas rosea]SER70514.1 Response regulator receiver domain-containing protein [Tranquillimonas rosea]